MDKELKAIRKSLVERVTELGKTRFVSGKKVRELINVPVHFPSYYEVTGLSKSQAKYVDDKILDYEFDLSRCISLLEFDRTSRQAVVQLDIESEFPNCMISLQFQVRDDSLTTTVIMRSWDVKEKFFQDYAIASRMSKRIAEKLKCEIKGTLFFATNAHYYL